MYGKDQLVKLAAKKDWYVVTLVARDSGYEKFSLVLEA